MSSNIVGIDLEWDYATFCWAADAAAMNNYGIMLNCYTTWKHLAKMKNMTIIF